MNFWPHSFIYYKWAYLLQCLLISLLPFSAGCDLDWVNFDLYAPMDHALRHSDHDMVALLLRAGCCTQELRGQTYWCEDRSKSFFHALCSDTTLDNVRLYLDCGYAVPDSEMSSLKILSQMLSADPREKRILDMLTEFTEKPKSLMWRCRQMVRQLLMETRWRQHTPMEAMIASLPLPSQLKEFLSLTPPPTQLWEGAGKEPGYRGSLQT